MDIDPHYTHPTLAELYDLESGWSIDRDYYLALAGNAPQKIIDVGCGTGMMAVRFAALGHEVTGVDPAKAMLDIARNRSGSDAVSWEHASGDTFQAPGPFDLAVMTGHVFQVFPTEAATISVLAHIAQALGPNGRLVFETRNPERDWAVRWSKESVFCGPNGQHRQTRRIDATGPNWITFTTVFHLAEQTQESTSTLRFPGLSDVQRMLRAAGLQQINLHGDWNGADFDPARHDELIFHCSPIADVQSQD